MVSPASEAPPPYTPRIEILPAGTGLHRVYGNKRKVSEFNPGFRKPRRFTFPGDPKVPVLYASTTLQTAVCESILHNIPNAGGVLFKAEYEDRVSAGLRTTRDLRLASFKGEGLLALGIEQVQLTTREAAWYQDTVKGAEAAYAEGLDGCVWMSRRFNDDCTYVFFDRTQAALVPDPSMPVRAYLNGPDLDRKSTRLNSSHWE